MIFLKILGIIALVIFLILMIPLRIRVSYYDNVAVTIPILFFKIKIYPKTPKLKSMSKNKFDKLNGKKDEKNRKKKKKKSIDSDSDRVTKSSNKLSVSDVLPIIGEISELVGKILSSLSDYLKVKIYALRFVISGDDAAKTAITYGTVTGAAGTLMRILEDRCRISYSRNAEAGVFCDFLSGHTTVKVDIRFSIFVWQVIALGIKALINFLKIKSKLEVRKNAGNENK